MVWHCYRQSMKKVVQAAQQHGLGSDAFLEVRRLGAPKADADRPRPVLVRCRTENDKHLAFKARSALKPTGIALGNHLSSAHRDARRAQNLALDRLRQEPGANPHFRSEQLHFWSNGQLLAYDAPQHARPA